MKPIPREIVIRANKGPSKYDLYILIFYIVMSMVGILYYSREFFLSPAISLGGLLPIIISVSITIFCWKRLRRQIQKRKEIVEMVQDRLILQDIYDSIKNKKPLQVRVSEK
jgi:hypothetical protein